MRRSNYANYLLKYFLFKYVSKLYSPDIRIKGVENLRKNSCQQITYMGPHSQLNSFNCLPLPFIENLNNWFGFSSPLVTYSNSTQKHKKKKKNILETRTKNALYVIGIQNWLLHSDFRTALLRVPLANGTASGKNRLPMWLAVSSYFPHFPHFHAHTPYWHTEGNVRKKRKWESGYLH